ncbi:hypothetical protein NA57DRAFT_62096 [Rhizodiscina lignyota]|uniref:Uncharacterized protein n=1 Tax=Rhizodiscina lignyota TaxID=1504668 RepID=A0A9P4I416_9PEZI|nr:hypothetical protein NA57DRAFT_62096 [Rhizodiscina lignyota]
MHSVISFLSVLPLIASGVLAVPSPPLIRPITALPEYCHRDSDHSITCTRTYDDSSIGHDTVSNNPGICHYDHHDRNHVICQVKDIFPTTDIEKRDSKRSPIVCITYPCGHNSLDKKEADATEGTISRRGGKVSISVTWEF